MIANITSMATVSTTQNPSTRAMMAVSGMIRVTPGAFGVGEEEEAEDTGECEEAGEGIGEVTADEVTAEEVGPCVVVVVGRIATAGGKVRMNGI